MGQNFKRFSGQKGESAGTTASDFRFYSPQFSIVEAINAGKSIMYTLTLYFNF